jgi:hypothetical protein
MAPPEFVVVMLQSGALSELIKPGSLLTNGSGHVAERRWQAHQEIRSQPLRRQGGRSGGIAGVGQAEKIDAIQLGGSDSDGVLIRVPEAANRQRRR